MYTRASAHARAVPGLLWCKRLDICHFYVNLGTLTAVVLGMAGLVPYHWFLGACVVYQIVGPKVRASIRDGWKVYRAHQQDELSEPPQPSHSLYSSTPAGTCSTAAIAHKRNEAVVSLPSPSLRRAPLFMPHSMTQSHHREPAQTPCALALLPKNQYACHVTALRTPCVSIVTCPVGCCTEGWQPLFWTLYLAYLVYVSRASVVYAYYVVRVYFGGSVVSPKPILQTAPYLHAPQTAPSVAR